MKYLKLALLLLSFSFLNGCFFTKIATVPMRVGGAIVSIVPGAGNKAHDVIDEVAESIDELPF